MIRKRFETEEVDRVLGLYKRDPSSDNLEQLYVALDSIIETVTARIAKTFRSKNPEDFLDIKQNVKIDIYKVLPKLSSISTTGNQVIAITVNACVWSFRTHYKKWKKDNPIPAHALFNAVEEGDMRTAGTHCVHTPPNKGWSYYYSSDSTGDNKSPLDGIFVLPNQYDKLYLKSIGSELISNALKKNRFPEKDSLVKFCLQNLIEGRTASSAVISGRWGAEKTSFWPKYSGILLKIALENMVNTA